MRVQPQEGREGRVGQQQGLVALLLRRDGLGLRDDGSESRHVAFHREIPKAPRLQGFADTGETLSVAEEFGDGGAGRIGVEVGHCERSGAWILGEIVGKAIGFAETNDGNPGQGRVHGDVREGIEPRRDHHDVRRRIGSFEVDVDGV